MRQLARDDRVGEPSAYTYIHERLVSLAAQAPDLLCVLDAAKSAEYTHPNLDGTLIRNDRVQARGSTIADLL